MIWDVNKVEENLKMKKLVPWIDLTPRKESYANKKINVVFHIGTATEHWSSVKPLYDSFLEDKKYNVLVVPANSPHIEEDAKRILRDNVPIAKEVELSESIIPDIVIASGFGYNEPYELPTIKIFGKAKMTVGIFSKLVDFDICGTPEKYYEYFGINSRVAHCDYCLADTSLYKRLIEDTNEIRRNKLIEMGHPKFDRVFLSTKEKCYPLNWKKLEGRTVILWAPVHGVYNKKVQWWYTVDVYANRIIKYASEHKEVGLIIRLQNMLIWELIEQGIWSYRDIEALKGFCERSENIIFDDEDSYIPAYSIMDGVITDNRCSVEHTAFPTLKPICILYRNDMELGSDTQDLKEILYSAHNLDDIDKFYEMIVQGNDPMLDIRKRKMNSFVKNFDGKNTERIKEFIEKKFYDKWVLEEC